MGRVGRRLRPLLVGKGVAHARVGRTPASVEPDRLRCGACRSWFPDGHFAKNANAKYEYRRFRGGTCKTCMAERRIMKIRRDHGPTRKEQIKAVRDRLDPGPLPLKAGVIHWDTKESK